MSCDENRLIDCLRKLHYYYLYVGDHLEIDSGDKSRMAMTVELLLLLLPMMDKGVHAIAQVNATTTMKMIMMMWSR